MKLVILVQSSNDPRYGPCAQTVAATWAAQQVGNVTTYLYFGRRDDMLAPPVDGAYRDDNLLVCDAPDVHFNQNGQWVEVRTQKFIRALEWVLANDDSADFIYRCNCTCYIDQAALYDFAIRQSATGLYSGPMCIHHDGTHLASGCDLLLSRDVAQYLVDHQDQLDPALIDDVAFGRLLAHDRQPPLEIANRGMTIYRTTPINDLKRLPGVFHYKFSTESMDALIHFHHLAFSEL